MSIGYRDKIVPLSGYRNSREQEQIYSTLLLANGGGGEGE
jgi:hypothetical protein